MNNQSVQPNLVLSLTSHPPRFPFLLTQLNRVSKQTLFPDLLVLNIAEEDYSEIPKELAILDLPFAFEINLVENLGPGTKLIPTLIKYPTSTIITIDDDIDYPESLIESLWMESKDYPGAIIAARAHQPLFLGRKIAPYLSWDFEITETANRLVFPTGGGGIFYPPNSLHKEVLNTEIYKNMSWSTDDIWFWVHSLRAGTKIRKSRFSFKAENVLESQIIALNSTGNTQITNDLNLLALWNFYNMEPVLNSYMGANGLLHKFSNLGYIRTFRSPDLESVMQKESFQEMVMSFPKSSRMDYLGPILKLEQQILRLRIEENNLRTNLLNLFKNVKSKVFSKIKRSIILSTYKGKPLK